MIEVRAVRSFRNDAAQVQVHETEMLNLEGKLIFSLVERWGMVVTKTAGEDSSGRAKLDLATPEEVVIRACKTAQLLMSHGREKGFIVSVGTMAELEAQLPESVR